MSSRFLRLAARKVAVPQPDRRRVERHNSAQPIEIIAADGRRAPARLRDVSPYGCNLQSDADWTGFGRFVTLQLAPERAVQAMIRWSDGDAAGVEFLRAISEAEAEALASRG